MKHPFTLCGGLLLLSLSALAEEKPVYKSCLEYIQKTGKLSGISEIRLNADGTVDLVHDKTGFFLMYGPDKKTTDQARLETSQSCLLMIRHLSMRYQFKGVKDGVPSFEATENFNGLSLRRGEKTETATVAIKPYKTEAKPQTEPPPEKAKTQTEIGK